MKKLSVLILLLCLCLNLAACGGEELALVPRTHGDLTIGIPEDFIDLSGEEYFAGFDLVYGLDPIAINGLRETKQTFAAFGLELDLQRYGELVILSNKVDCELEKKDGIYTFTYASGDYTYMVTLWETQDAFWTVQAYCPTADFEHVGKDMWQILSSISV